MQRTCVKCGHEHPNANGSDTEACPSCGAIYAKAGTVPWPSGRPASSGFGQPSRFGGGGRQRAAGVEASLSSDDLQHYVVVMRAQSLYPTVRTLVKLGHWFMVIIAVLVALAGMMAARATGPAALVGGVCGALFIVIFSLALRELSLMLADLSDASVRAAAVAEGER